MYFFFTHLTTTINILSQFFLNFIMQTSFSFIVFWVLKITDKITPIINVIINSDFFENLVVVNKTKRVLSSANKYIYQLIISSA